MSSAQTASRYVVGLDLGTTNCALAYIDTVTSPDRIEAFLIPQVVAPGQIESRETLPSFLYQPALNEFPPNSCRLPWQKSDPREIVGQFARDHGTVSPGRVISSAKSWLCHPGVDRTADLLPWHGAADVPKLSPVAVSAKYLEHIRQAWDEKFPGDPLAEQDFVLTLPASFDEVARELTIRAAQQAGLKKVVLIEEPQAAFYAWIAKHASDWEQLVSPGQTILICDVGGGTSDFTLIRAQKLSNGSIQFHRIAVGDHLILGGDNMDLALAHHLEQKIKPEGKLEARPWNHLLRSCRAVKEILMDEHPPSEYTLSIPGNGSKLIGGATQVTVTKQDVDQLLIDGFFPQVELSGKPAVNRSGFQEFGLPYAADAAITRHLAAFLTAHFDSDVTRDAKSDAPLAVRPDFILFNGGVFGSSQLRTRLVKVIERWFRSNDPEWSLTALDNERLDLAVAKGAAYFGMVRRGIGVRIAAGLARSYYVGVAGDPPQAVCLAPAGIEPGDEIDLSQRQFEVLVSQPIEFPIYYSSVRLTDKPGDVITIDAQQLTALPPIRTVLRAGGVGDSEFMTVTLQARLNEIGTLDLWCRETQGKRSWKLLFDVRSATQTDIIAHESSAELHGVIPEDRRLAAEQIIAATFTSGGDEPALLMKRLAETLGSNRDDWPPSLLRQFWELLFDRESARRLSPAHEARWLNLLGFSLRPGYGFALDDWRVGETWKLLQSKLVHHSANSRTEWWILWRRIAGGLTAGQQQALIGPLINQIQQIDKAVSSKSGGITAHEAAELCRAAGACELLPAAAKIELGRSAIAILRRKPSGGLRAAVLWMLARLGARRPSYGPLNLTVDASTASRWLEEVLKFGGDESIDWFTVMQLSRKTGDRHRDLDDATRDRVLAWLDRQQAPELYRNLVQKAGTLDSESQKLAFGDSLPIGLRIL